MTSIAIDRLDGLSSATAMKGPCRVATTANITLSGEQTIDTVAVVEGDRVLVKDQTDATTNGIYSVNTGLWTRTKDFSNNRDVQKGTRVYVTDGAGAGEYRVSSSNPVTVGSSNITFVKFGATDFDSVASVVPGSGIDVDATDPQNPVVALEPAAVGTSFLAAKAVTNAKLDDMAAATVKGRAAGAGTGAPVDLTAAQIKAILSYPTSTTDNAIARWDGSAGTAVQNSSLILDDSGAIADTSSVVGSPTKFWNPTYYGNAGTAVVHKFNRVMIGEATVGSTDQPMSTPDWLETLIPGTTANAQLASVSATGGLGVVGASRTNDFRSWAGSATGGSQGVSGFGYQNDPGSGNPIAVGVNGAALLGSVSTSGIAENEFTAASDVTVSDITPVSGVVGQTAIAANITAGFGSHNSNISAGINLGSSNGTAKMRAGINIEDDGLDTSVGSGGGGAALQMGEGAVIRVQKTSDSVWQSELWGADGRWWAASPLWTGAALVPTEQITVQVNDFTGSNVSTAQPVFASAQDTITLAANTTYMFEAEYRIDTTGTTSHSLAVLFGGTATFSSVSGTAIATNGSAATTPSAPLMRHLTSAGAATLTTAVAAATENVISLKGVIRITTSGTLIPQFQYSAAPGAAPAVRAGSFFKLKPIGSNTVAAVGPWG